MAEPFKENNGNLKLFGGLFVGIILGLLISFSWNPQVTQI
jgi:hypothetical protein